MEKAARKVASVAGPMRVGFDVSVLHRPHPRGIVRAVRGLTDALERRGRIEVVRLAPKRDAHLARWRQVELPRFEARAGLAGIHSCLSSFPLSGRGRRVQTIHELPWLHGVAENAGWRHRLWARIGPLRADVVLTATEATARDVRAYSGARATRVHVVPWGVDPVFTPQARPDDAAILARHGLTARGYVLCPGAGRAKKRPEDALAGAAALARRGGPCLAIAVTGQAQLDAVMSGGLTLLGELDDGELAALYRHAAATAVLARSEGFGLPVLESFASGTPVVVRAGGAQAEVAGAAGIAVDTRDPESLAGGFARALAATPEQRAACVARAAEFSWDRCAAGVEMLWLELGS